MTMGLGFQGLGFRVVEAEIELMRSAAVKKETHLGDEMGAAVSQQTEPLVSTEQDLVSLRQTTRLYRAADLAD